MTWTDVLTIALIGATLGFTLSVINSVSWFTNQHITPHTIMAALIGTALISAAGFLIAGSIGLILKLSTDLLN